AGSAVELGDELGQAGTLLLAGRVEPLGLDCQARGRLGEQLLLALADGRHLRREALLGPLEVARELGEPPADSLLDLRKRFAQLGTRPALALVQRRAPFLGHPAL